MDLELKRRISNSIKVKYGTDPEYRAKILKALEKGRKKSLESKKQSRLNREVTIEDRHNGGTIKLDITNKELEEYRKTHPVCEICGKSCKTGRSLAVDHCHQTNQFRGLLCAVCNTKFDWFLENKESIIRYANKP